MQYNTTDTIVAIATPHGEGAIGVIRVSGKKAVEWADELFDGSDLGRAKGYTLHFGSIKSGNEVVDEVLLSLFRAPKSYTGEDVVEISCHGSPYILERVLHLFIGKGARMASRGEFTLRAFMNGKMDLSQAEAVADLIASSSKGAHDLAISQMRGGFSAEIKRLRQELVDFASLLELELDFSEEDVEFADRSKLVELINKILTLLRALLQSFSLGNVIKKGVQTVIAGRPNAGKSTLLNTLLKEERAIVSEIAGTTRDTIEDVLNINGVEFRLIDTAGIREATDQIEAIGVQRTMEQISKSAVLVYVFDPTALSLQEVREEINRLAPKDIPALIIANKQDLDAIDPSDPDWLALQKGYSTIQISALKKEGIEKLTDALYHTAIQTTANQDSVIVANARHFEALQKSAESLESALTGLNSGISSDFIAMDIRQALHYLGEITGEVTTDEILGNIFSKFCIGK